MKGDYTRVTFRPEKHYSGVLMQQGRVQLDADWNEQQDIEDHRIETGTADVVGACGGPRAGAGFGLRAEGGDILIGAGRYYVDGILCENDLNVGVAAQPDLPGFVLPSQAGMYLGYVDVWEREVTALDDPAIREVALGGPDTSTRSKTVWQVKLLRVGDPIAVPEEPAPSETPPSEPPPGPELPPRGRGPIPSPIPIPMPRPIPSPFPRPFTLEPRPPISGGAGPSVARGVFSSSLLASELAAEAVAPPPTVATIDPNLLRAIMAPGFGIGGRFHPAPGTSTEPPDPASPPSGGAPNCGSEFAEWDALLAGGSGMLSARATPEADSDGPCIVPAAAGYRRLENQLYRVEVHDPGEPGAATFKWSRDNGSVVSLWTAQSGNDVTISGIGRDLASGFASGQWVELTDDTHELAGTPGTLVRLSKTEGLTLTIDPASATGSTDRGDFPSNPKVRRWDSLGAPRVTTDPTDGWIALEGGVEVRFGPGSYASGDYWLIPARTVTGGIEWPMNGSGPAARPPDGVRHHYCRLALLQLDDSGWTALTDCRSLFPAITELLGMYYVGGDGQEVVPDPSEPGALLALRQPLRVGVASGQWPVAGATVRFQIAAGAGRLQGAGVVVDVTTGNDGLAACAWEVDSVAAMQQVVATLLDPTGTAMHLPVVFTAGLIAASGGGPAPTPLFLSVAAEGTETVAVGQQVLVPATPLAAAPYSADISIAEGPAPGVTRRISWQEEYVVSQLGFHTIDVSPGEIATAPTAGVDVSSGVVHLPLGGASNLERFAPIGGGAGTPTPTTVRTVFTPISVVHLPQPVAAPAVTAPAAIAVAPAAPPHSFVHVPVDALAGAGLAEVAADVAHIPAGAAEPAGVIHVDPATLTPASDSPPVAIAVAHVPADVVAAATSPIAAIDVTHVTPVSPNLIGSVVTAPPPGTVIGPGIVPSPGIFRISFIGRQWRVTNLGDDPVTVSYRIYRIPTP
jgi:hypothetical protein